MSKPKFESVDEFLARGGTITKVDLGVPIKQEVMHAAQGGPVNILSLEDADLYYGEKRKQTAKIVKKKKDLIDLSALPPELRRKYVDNVMPTEED